MHIEIKVRVNNSNHPFQVGLFVDKVGSNFFKQDAIVEYLVNKATHSVSQSSDKAVRVTGDAQDTVEYLFIKQPSLLVFLSFLHVCEGILSDSP